MKPALAPALAALVLLALLLAACGETIERPAGVVYVNVDAIASDPWAIEQCLSQVPLLTYGEVRPVRVVLSASDVTVPRVTAADPREQRGYDTASCERAILAFAGVPLHSGPGILGEPITTYWTDADATSFDAAGYNR